MHQESIPFLYKIMIETYLTSIYRQSVTLNTQKKVTLSCNSMQFYEHECVLETEDEMFSEFGNVRFSFLPFVPFVDLPGLSCVHHDTVFISDGNVDEILNDESVVRSDDCVASGLACQVVVQPDGVEDGSTDIPVEKNYVVDSALSWTTLTLKRLKDTFGNNSNIVVSKRYAEEQTQILKAFFTKSDKPSYSEKQEVASAADMTVLQVSTWFNNRRKRIIAHRRLVERKKARSDRRSAVNRERYCA